MLLSFQTFRVYLYAWCFARDRHPEEWAEDSQNPPPEPGMSEPDVIMVMELLEGDDMESETGLGMEPGDCLTEIKEAVCNCPTVLDSDSASGSQEQDSQMVDKRPAVTTNFADLIAGLVSEPIEADALEAKPAQISSSWKAEVESLLESAPPPVVMAQNDKASKDSKKQKKELVKKDIKQKPAKAKSASAESRASFKKAGSPSTKMISHEGMGIPEEMYPDVGPRGCYSYTVHSMIGGAVVEVQLRNKGYYVKKMGAGLGRPDPCFFAWSKYGGATAAWEHLRPLIFWDIADPEETELHTQL